MSIREHPVGVRVVVVVVVVVAAAALVVVAFVGSGRGAVGEVAVTVPTTAPQVFVVGADGQHLRRVTFGPAAHRVLFWMPGGASIADIAYTAPSERGWIESQRTGSRAHRRLSATVSNNSPVSLAFSAASRLTAFGSFSDESQRLEVVGPPGSQPRVLDSWSGLYNSDFTQAWSPDGHLIAYIPVDGPPPPSSVNGEPQWRLTVIAPDGQGRRTVTPAPVSNNFTPLFSPDGQLILYCGQAPQDLYTVPTSGGPGHRVIQGGYCSQYLAAWSPNGQQIAYIIGASGAKHYYLNVVNVQTEAVRRLAGPLQIAGPPQNWGALAWSPNGHKIAFAQSDAVETINADGTDLRDLAQIRGSVTIGLAWSPNSHQIAFTLTGHPCSCY